MLVSRDETIIASLENIAINSQPNFESACAMSDRTSALSLSQLSMFRQQLACDPENAAAHLHPIGDTSRAYVLKSLHFQWFQRYLQNQMERVRQFQTF